MTKQIVCNFCVMDKSDPDITFNDEGVCNHCEQAQKSLREVELEKPNLNKWIKQIKKDGQNRKHNCICGLSGGVDSSTTLHYLVKMGLKPLCFSLDNKYNEPVADENVKRMVEKLKVSHIVKTINQKKYAELQGAFLKSGVKNVEIITDHILMAMTYELAEKNNIKWILSGGNVATESIMPVSWGYQARDLTHIKDIYKRFTGKRLAGLPMCGLLKWNYYKWWSGIKIFYLLDYLDYNRIEAEKMLIKEYGFQSTGEKHEENIWTKWFQNYYLFKKFGIDKRKAHYSSLINSGQMTRKEAMFALTASPVYPHLGLEERAGQYERHSHYDYKTDEWLYNLICKTVKLCKKLAL